MLEKIENAVGSVNDVVYTYVLIAILLVAGIYFTIRTGFAQFRLFPKQIKCVTEKPKDGSNISSFQALMVSTASRVGTGNIIGVSTAICLGGYGSVFWMWVTAVLGSASAFIESTLAQIYKRRGPDGWYGGPAYYIETGLKSRPLAAVFSVLLILTYGVGFNMLASFNLQSTFESYSFYDATYTKWIIGLITALLVGVCLFGGGKRIAKITGVLVPVMGVTYICVALVIVFLNFDMLPGIFKEIFRSAFDFKAIFGGFTGSCVMLGIKRGLFSNEAGVGSAPNASATADVSHPVQQGLVQVLSVFIDTILVCSATAFMCICSGVTPSADISGAKYVQLSLQRTLGDFGPIFITVSMVLFAFTTLIGNLYYVDQSLFFLNKKKPSRSFMSVYYVIASLLILVGAGLSADLLWGVADITMAAMTIINVPVIIILGKYALRALKDYDRKTRRGLPMTFYSSDIKLPDTVDAWQAPKEYGKKKKKKWHK